MQDFGPFPSHFGVDNLGIRNANTVYWHLTTPMLYEQAARRREGTLAHLGPLIVRTGDHTGRSPNDKFIVKEPTSEGDIWWGKVNRPISQENFDSLLRKVLAYTQQRDVYVFDGYAGADERYRLPVRIITEYAWHNLFARNMFIRPPIEELATFAPNFTVYHAPEYQSDPAKHGTNSGTFIVLNLAERTILIGGTRYAGELKKAMFTVMNYRYGPLWMLIRHHTEGEHSASFATFIYPDRKMLCVASSPCIKSRNDVCIEPEYCV